jgi:hypothetical protein
MKRNSKSKHTSQKQPNQSFQLRELPNVRIEKLSNVEIQIVIDNEGIKCVRILGSSEEHEAGHKMYFQLFDLIKNFDKAVQARLKEKDDEKTGKERLNL